ncbi:unnamed protein product [Gadus morhua 'NCC']
MVTDSSSEGNGSQLPEEPEVDIPLAGSPNICEGTLPGVLECSLTSGGTDQRQRQPAKRKKKRGDRAVNEEVVLMQTIGKPWKGWQQEHHGKRSTTTTFRCAASGLNTGCECSRSISSHSLSAGAAAELPPSAAGGCTAALLPYNQRRTQPADPPAS